MTEAVPPSAALQLEKVVAKNSELSTGNLSLRREVAALQDLQAAFAARCHAAQKAVQNLVELWFHDRHWMSRLSQFLSAPKSYPPPFSQ